MHSSQVMPAGQDADGGGVDADVAPPNRYAMHSSIVMPAQSGGRGGGGGFGAGGGGMPATVGCQPPAMSVYIKKMSP